MSEQVTFVHPINGVELVAMDAPVYGYWGDQLWNYLHGKDKKQLVVLPPTVLAPDYEVIRCDRFNVSPVRATVSMPASMFVSTSHQEALWWAIVEAEEIWGE